MPEKTVIWDSLESRFPDASIPPWYESAISVLRGGADAGRFGLYLYNLIKTRPDIEVVLNIGTARGYSAVCCAKGLAEKGADGMVYTVDPIPPNEQRHWHVEKQPDSDPARGEERSMRGLVEEIHPEDSEVGIRFLTGGSNEVLRDWGYEPPDLVFHDGLHTYRTVKEDIRRSLEITAEPPVQVFDDCHIYPDKQVDGSRLLSFSRLREIPKLGGLVNRSARYTVTKDPFPGVSRAVQEVARTGPYEAMEIVRDQNHSPITALCRRYVPQGEMDE